jgi:hypothetical protein
MTQDTRTTPPKPTTMSDELLALLRQRVQTRYYDRPDVIAAVAQAIASRGSGG